MREWFFAPAAFLAAYPAFRSLDPHAQQELAEALEPVEFRTGEILFAPGDRRDAVFLILCGSISFTGGDPSQRPEPARVLGPGEVVGEIGLADDGPHAGAARALDDTLVLRLTRVAFERMSEKYPDVVSALSLSIAPAARKMLLARVVSDLLGELDAAQRSTLLAEMECLHLNPGDVLVRGGTEGDRMFVIVYGRLRMTMRDAGGTETVLGEIGRGEVLDEQTLLRGDIPGATVYAARESAVGVITRSLIDTLQYHYPEVVVRLTRMAVRRMEHAAARVAATPRVSQLPDAVSVAVVPVGGAPGAVPATAFAERLATSLSAFGTTLRLNSARLAALIDAPPAACPPSGAALAVWLQQQEQSYDCVIYEADETWTPWTECCLRMSDRVLLVGLGASPPLRTPLDEPLARLSDSTRTELVLLQAEGTARPSGTAAWLDRYPAAGHDHVCMERQADFDRFVRHITRCGPGLVLGGGGARGFAHIGVFRALAELGIAVDMIGGTSMGAVLGAMLALGLTHDEISQLARRLASPMKLFDPTLPVVSFFASGKVTRVLEHIYGDTQIEDLWTPFFCVSSNLTRGSTMVHRRGPLWQAVRASMAIPGVFSPVLADGDLLVDGCVLDNLPIDVMQRVNYGGPIIAVNVFPDVDLLRHYEFGPSVSGWRALAGAVAGRARLVPSGHKDGPPLIFESLVRVMALNGVQQAKTQRGYADVYIRPPVEQFNILDFGAHRHIAEIGYRSALDALRQWEGAPVGAGKSAGQTIAEDNCHSAGRQSPRVSVTAPLYKTLADLEALLSGRR